MEVIMSEQLWTNAPKGECTDADIGQTEEVYALYVKQMSDPAEFRKAIDAVVASDDWRDDLNAYAREAWKDANMRAECTYCGHMTFVEPSPVWDDEAWDDIADEHDSDCEWVRTRAHMLPEKGN
jgi:DNA-binding transcriptional regulator/RsmH inhibitor MraZ